MPERHSASAEAIGSDAASPGMIGTVGESAMILGYAGLLPQIAAAATCAFDQTTQTGGMFAFGYAALILSFLGGIWWVSRCAPACGRARSPVWRSRPRSSRPA